MRSYAMNKARATHLPGKLIDSRGHRRRRSRPRDSEVACARR